MAIKIEQYQKTADGSYQLMYPKTQADCVSVSSGGNLQTKLSDIDKKVTYELTCSKTGSTHAPVSYTHLDVYKRQLLHHCIFAPHSSRKDSI